MGNSVAYFILSIIPAKFSAAAALGSNVSAFEVLPFLFYPYALLISSLLFIYLGRDRK